MIQETRTHLLSQVEDIHPGTPEADVRRIYGAVLDLLKIAKEIRADADEAMVKWLQAHGNKLELGPGLELIASKDKTIKPRNLAAVTEAVLEATGGDVDAMVKLLSSDPFKQGSVKQVVGEDRHGELFKTVWKDKVSVKQINTDFVKK